MESILQACHIKELEVHRAKLTTNNIRVLSGDNLPHLKRFCAVHASLEPITALRDLLSAFPPLDQLELNLAHFAIYDRTVSLGHGHVHVKRLHITIDVPRYLPHRDLSDLCAGLKELKLICCFKDSEVPDLVNNFLRSWDAKLDCFHVHVNNSSGSLRKSPHLLA
jgi:hypothetical protein